METLNTTNAPLAIGPYSQSVRTGQLLYCSGQTPIDPATGKLINGNVGLQTQRAINNLRAVLANAGLSLSSVVKTNVFLTNMDDFAEMNEAYQQAFDDHSPARTTVAVRALPLNAAVEIECIAEFN